MSKTKGLQKFAFLKYYSIDMRKFILRLEASKNTAYIANCFKQKLRRIKFHKKKLRETHFYLPQEWNPGASKIWWSDLINSIWKQTDTILLFQSYLFYSYYYN